MKETAEQEQQLFPIPIEQGKEFAENHIEEICTVQELAKKMGYSRSYLSRSIGKIYGMSPSEMLRRLRFKKIKKTILKYPHETSYAIARRVGLKNEKTLYKFLSTHWDTNFTALRKKLVRQRMKQRKVEKA